MGRVPQNTNDASVFLFPRFLLIGSGRLARHFRYYFAKLEIPLLCWSRNGDPSFNSNEFLDAESDPLRRLAIAAEQATHIWILTKDSAIEEIGKLCRASSSALQLHCSGSLTISGVYGVHPLMTFGHQLYSIDVYKKIPFICEPDAPELSQLSQRLLNPQVRISIKDKPLYHALCVASGNFSVLLWQMARVEFERLGIHWSLLQSYLEATFHNLSTNPDHALTGPLARFDRETIEKNLAALKGHDLGPIYSLFWETFQRRRDNG